jgi:hypothetical protein
MIILQLSMMKTIKSSWKELSGLCFSMIIDVPAAARKATFGTSLSPRDSHLLRACWPRRQNRAQKMGCTRNGWVSAARAEHKAADNNHDVCGTSRGQAKGKPVDCSRTSTRSGYQHCAENRNLQRGIFACFIRDAQAPHTAA